MIERIGSKATRLQSQMWFVYLIRHLTFDNGFRTSGDCSEMWHKFCPHKRVTIHKKNNLSYFKIAKADARDIDKEENPDVMAYEVFEPRLSPARR